MYNAKKAIRKVIILILTWQVKVLLARHKPKIIAITGSVGKTSTKDAIFTVLSKFKKVRKSEKSYNGDIGLPLTILGLPNGWNNLWIWIENMFRGFYIMLFSRNYPEWLVLEVGAGKPGDIKRITKWLKPDITVITHFPDKPVHVEFFGSTEAIIEEKTALANALKEDGVLVLNHDDEKVYALHGKANRKTVSYGLHENATYHATHLTYITKNINGTILPFGINFKLEYEGNTYPVNMPHVVGLHNVGQALAALACAKETGCDMLEAIQSLAETVPPPGRLQFIEGLNQSVILDDTYNSSPIAVDAALTILDESKAMRKIAVLGDMLELGKLTESAHREVGERVKNIADILVVVGPRAKFIAEGAIDSGYSAKKIHSFDNSKDVGQYLEGIVQKGDIVLLKGSQGVRLEKAVLAIMAHPELKNDLLARQEKEWQNR